MGECTSLPSISISISLFGQAASLQSTLQVPVRAKSAFSQSAGINVEPPACGLLWGARRYDVEPHGPHFKTTNSGILQQKPTGYIGKADSVTGRQLGNCSLCMTLEVRQQRQLIACLLDSRRPQYYTACDIRMPSADERGMRGQYQRRHNPADHWPTPHPPRNTWRRLLSASWRPLRQQPPALAPPAGLCGGTSPARLQN